MTTQTQPVTLASTPCQRTQPQPITRAALEALIAAGGHELRLVRTIIDVQSDFRGSGGHLPSYATFRCCQTCGASTDEDAAGMDVDTRLLTACQEPTWVSYAWEQDGSDDGDEREGEE